jgi:hypothetical protein
MPLGGRRRSWLTTSRAFPRRNGLRRNHAGAIASPSQRRAALPNFGESPLKAHSEGTLQVRMARAAVAFTSEQTGIVSLSPPNGPASCRFRSRMDCDGVCFRAG